MLKIRTHGGGTFHAFMSQWPKSANLWPKIGAMVARGSPSLLEGCQAKVEGSSPLFLVFDILFGILLVGNFFTFWRWKWLRIGMEMRPFSYSLGHSGN